MMTESEVLLFVYGTLMPGGALHGQIQRFVRGVRPGLITGVLIDLGAFPALTGGPGFVRGVLLDLAPEALALTDRIEGFRPDLHHCMYHRVETEVHLDDGTTITAWTYRYVNPSVLSDHPHLVVAEMDGQPVHGWRPRR